MLFRSPVDLEAYVDKYNSLKRKGEAEITFSDDEETKKWIKQKISDNIDNILIYLNINKNDENPFQVYRRIILEKLGLCSKINGAL